MNPHWSYDPIAPVYDRLMGPRTFDAPARDLVEMVGLRESQGVLDVGTGTGLAACAAERSLGRHGFVVGLDPSLAMLRFARAKGVRRLIAASVPGIPFPAGSFDTVLTGFVLSHFSDRQGAMLDLVRVLKRGGRLGATAWQISDDEFTRVWKEVAKSFVDLDRLAQAVREAIPWEEWFSQPDHLREAFDAAGLNQVSLAQREYRARVSLADYLLLLENRASGRLLQQMLEPAAWQSFRQSVAATLRTTFSPPIEYLRTANFALGTKPF